MNTQDTSSRFSPKAGGSSKGRNSNGAGSRPHILMRREARRIRRDR